MTESQEQHLERLKFQATAMIDQKYRAGAKEHPGELLDMDIVKLLDEARNENTDQSTYLNTLKDKLSDAFVSGYITLNHVPFRLLSILDVEKEVELKPAEETTGVQQDRLITLIDSRIRLLSRGGTFPQLPPYNQATDTEVVAAIDSVAGKKKENDANRRREVQGECDQCFEEFGSGSCIRPSHAAFKGPGGVQSAGKWASKLNADGSLKTIGV